jgi:hypothetical protein
MSKTYSIDTSTPASGESPRLGDDKIRELKLATVELMQVDHYMGTPTGTAYDSDDAGKHVKVTFRESQTVKPSIGTDKGMLYTKGETPELFYEDSAGNETQLTDQGKIPFTSLNNLANDTYLKAKDPAGTGTVDLIKAGRNEADDADVAVLPDATRTMTNAAPTEATQIANKKYVDDKIAKTVGSGVMSPLSYAGGQSVTLPNGFILKFGSISSGTVTFAVPFPNACINAIACAGSGGASEPTVDYGLSVANISKTGFGIYARIPSRLYPYRWLAIGY